MAIGCMEQWKHLLIILEKKNKKKIKNENFNKILLKLYYISTEKFKWICLGKPRESTVLSTLFWLQHNKNIFKKNCC